MGFMSGIFGVGDAEHATPRSEKWREILEEGDWPLFNTLREWRY